MEIEKITETEYKLGENSVTLIDRNIIYVVARGEQTGEMAVRYKKICEMLYENIRGKVSYLINLNLCGRNDSDARNTWKKISEDERTHRVGIFGLNPVAKVIASFVIGTYSKNNMRFFGTKEDAMKWILEE